MGADLDQYESLSKFLGLIQNYNKGIAMNENLKAKIEQYFDYKWKFDKNQAIDDESE